VTEAIEYEQFDEAAQPGNGAVAEVDLSRLSDIPMELSVEIGRTHMTVGETLDLRAGSVVTLERLAGEAADLLVNGTAIARGEVVVMEEQYGLRITEILDGQQDSQLAEHDPRSVLGSEDGGAQDTQRVGAAAAEPEPAEAADADGSPAGEG